MTKFAPGDRLYVLTIEGARDGAPGMEVVVGAGGDYLGRAAVDAGYATAQLISRASGVGSVGEETP